VRNNIQQFKIEMADEVINAGRFDQCTTQEERRMTLEALLHDEDRYQQAVDDVPSMKVCFFAPNTMIFAASAPAFFSPALVLLHFGWCRPLFFLCLPFSLTSFSTPAVALLPRPVLFFPLLFLTWPCSLLLPSFCRTCSSTAPATMLLPLPPVPPITSPPPPSPVPSLPLRGRK